jgi:integrase
VLYANEARKGVPTRIAMRLMLLVFVRTSELIETPWSEIDLEKGEWIIPWKRMKRGKRRSNPYKNDHHVCLSRQALGRCASCIGMPAAVRSYFRTCAIRSGP